MNNIEYINYEDKYVNQIVSLWNKECYKDPITVEKFVRQAINDDNFDSSLCYLALDSENVIGFIMATKRKVPYLERGLEEKRGWINVLFVDEKYQRQHVGTTLYNYVEKKLKELGVEEITLAAYSPGYFFSGIDEENYPKAKEFFLNKGYLVKESHYSMGRNIKNYVIPNELQIRKENFEKIGYRFTRFTLDKEKELIDFLTVEFPGGWKRNALLALDNNTAEDVIIIVTDPKNEICGFSMSAIDGNPERFGPIGMGKEYRNSGLGSILLHYSFSVLASRKIEKMFFMSTDEPGKRYYLRNGLEVYRTYKDYRKNI